MTFLVGLADRAVRVRAEAMLAAQKAIEAEAESGLGGIAGQQAGRTRIRSGHAGHAKVRCLTIFVRWVVWKQAAGWKWQQEPRLQQLKFRCLSSFRGSSVLGRVLLEEEAGSGASEQAVRTSNVAGVGRAEKNVRQPLNRTTKAKSQWVSKAATPCRVSVEVFSGGGKRWPGLRKQLDCVPTPCRALRNLRRRVFLDFRLTLPSYPYPNHCQGIHKQQTQPQSSPRDQTRSDILASISSLIIITLKQSDQILRGAAARTRPNQSSWSSLSLHQSTHVPRYRCHRAVAVHHSCS